MREWKDGFGGTFLFGMAMGMEIGYVGNKATTLKTQ